MLSILIDKTERSDTTNLQFRLVQDGLHYKQKNNSLLVLLEIENFCQVENKSFYYYAIDVLFYQHSNSPSLQHTKTETFKNIWQP